MTGAPSWSAIGDVLNLQQPENDNEHLGRYLLIKVGLDFVLLNSDTGEEVYRLPKQGSLSSIHYDNNVIILDNGKTVFYGWDGTFYGYNISSDCKIFEIFKR